MSVITERLPSVDIQPRVDTLRLTVRHRWLLAAVAICAAIVSSIIAMLMPPTYVATSRLMPPQQNLSLASLFMGPMGSSPLASIAQKDLGIKNPADIYIGLLNSRSIQDDLVHDFNLPAVYRLSVPSDVRHELTARTHIQVTKEGLISISVEDREPQRAAALANGYVSELRRTTKRLAMSEAGQRREFFDDQVRQAKDDLNHAETNFKEVQQKTGILQIDAQAKVLIETAARLRAQMAGGEVQLRLLRSFSTGQNPEVQRQETQLAGWRAELARLESSQSGDPSFSKGRAPQQTQEYMEAMREVRYREAILEMLVRQFEAAKLDEGKEATIIQIVDVAIPPDRRSAPKRAVLVLFSIVMALAGTVGLLSLGERYRCNLAWQARLAQLRQDWRN